MSARAAFVLLLLSFSACCSARQLGSPRQLVIDGVTSFLHKWTGAVEVPADPADAMLGWNLPAGSKIANDKPLIGILTQACHSCPGKSYVAAAYVKWVESAGGRAVPIRFYDSEKELYRLFQSVNGLILPGGLTDLYLDDPYVIAARKLYNWAIKENDAGKVFPIWGTCLGHQLLQILASNVSFTELLVTTDAVSHPNTLQLTDAAKDSYLFQGIRPDLIPKIGDPTLNLIIQNHEFGLPPENFRKYPALEKMFNIISTSKDRNGLEYVSTIEAKKYPFFGTQWHPEKPPYEFSMSAIPHSADAIRISQHLANAFVDAARHSAHEPQSPEEELAMLIYNWKPIFTARDIVMEPSYDGPDITFFFDKEVEPPYGPDDGEVHAGISADVVSHAVMGKFA